MNITLITGASSGLGKEFAKLYYEKGNNVLLVGSNYERLLKAKNEIEKENNSCIIDMFEADLSDHAQRIKLKEYTDKQNYFVNNLINNAGFGDRTDFVDMDIDYQLKMNHLNCDAPLHLTKLYLDQMIQNNDGHIINVCSIAAYCSGPYMCTYHATKAYLLTFGESVSEELKNTNVKLLTLNPGPFESNFVNIAHNDYTFSKIKPMTAKRVAEFGYKMSQKGKKVKVIGFLNNLIVFGEHLFPRSLVTKISAKQIKKIDK